MVDHIEARASAEGTPIISLTPVTNFPSPWQLNNATKSPKLPFGFVENLVPTSLAEIFIDEQAASTLESAKNLANMTSTLLRARTRGTFRVIAISSESWNTLAAAEKESVAINPFVREWTSPLRLHIAESVDDTDMTWVLNRLKRGFELVGEPQFSIAVDALNGSPFQSERSSIATSWAGIEAIVGVSQELSYRLSMYLAVLLADDPEERETARARVKALYGKRSKAVHGSKMSEADLIEAAADSWKLLAEVICKILDRDASIPQPTNYDRRLLGHDWS